MNRFYTLTLNPALDRTMYFDTFVSGGLNRAVAPSRLTLGSKGINVSRFLSVCGQTAPAYGFAGGSMGQQMLAMLKEEGIETRFVPTAAETRLNVKMITADGVGTEANERGGPITEEERDALLTSLTEQARADREAGNTAWFFVGGSIPQGVEKSVYYRLVENLRKCGAHVLLDCDGEALKKGIKARPHLIKPNLFELSQLVGNPELTEGQVVENCWKLYRETAVRILCTMGGKGAVYAGPQGVYSVDAPRVAVRGFTGAGDTFLASFVYAVCRGEDITQSLAFAAGCAGAKVEMPGSEMPSLARARELAAERRVRKEISV